MRRVLGTVIRVAAFYLVWVLFAGFFSMTREDPVMNRIWAELPLLICVVVLTIGFSIIDRHDMTMPLLRNLPGGMITGSFFGAAWVGVAVLVLFLMERLAFQGVTEMTEFWWWALAILIHSTTQEMLFRGYVYQLIKGRHNAMAAFGVTTILYLWCAGFAWNEGIIPVASVLCFSILMTLLMEVTGNLITSILANASFHIMAGLVLGCIKMDPDYPHWINTVLKGSVRFTGGSCLLLGNVIFLLISAILVVMFASVRLMQRSAMIRQEREREEAEQANLPVPEEDESAYVF